MLNKCFVRPKISLQHAAVRNEKSVSKSRLIPPRASAQKSPKDIPCFQRPEILGKSLPRPYHIPGRYKVIHIRTMPAAEHSYLESLSAWTHFSLSNENIEAHVFPFEYVLENMWR